MSEKAKQTKNIGWAGKIAKFFINNDKISILLIMTIFVWGIMSYILTPKQYNPEIIAPSFQVQLTARSADSEEFYDRITKVVEDDLADLPGVEDVMSRTKEGGTAVITVNFFVGEDVEQSKIKVRQRLDEVRNHIPSAVSHITVKEQDPDNVPIMTLALISKEKSELELRDYAWNIKELVKKVDNVTNVDIYGGDKRELKVTLDYEKLNEYKLDPRVVVSKLKANNYRDYVGDVEDQGERKIIEVHGLWENLEDAKTLTVSKTDDGKPILLSDVAEVDTQAEEILSYANFKTQDNQDSNVVYIALAKKDGSNITVVTDAVQKELEQIKLEEGVELQVLRNEGKIALNEINDLTFNLLTAIVIVAIVLFIFLGWRPALIASLAIPMTVSTVFGVALLSGQTINRITLFALILSLGLLIDNATVIVENAVRHISLGKEKKNDAIARSVGEVGTGLILATLTTVLAFLPMLFVTGMMGPYMAPIPFFVPVALVASLLIAYSLNPYLSSVFLKNYNKKASKNLNWSDQIREDVVEIENYGHEKGHHDKIEDFYNGYKNLLKKIIENNLFRKLVLAGTALITILVLTLPALQLVKFRMLPKDDKEQFYVYLDYPDSTVLSKNLELTKNVENVILDDGEVSSIQTFISTSPIVDFNGMFRGVEGRNADNQSTIRINLTDPSEREVKSEDIAFRLRDKIIESNDQGEEIKVTVVEDAPGPPVRSTVMLKIKGLDRQNINEEEREKLKQITHDFENIFEETEGVVDIDTTANEPVKTLSFEVDSAKISKMGMTTMDVIDTLDIALDGRVISLYRDTVDKERENIFVTFKQDLETDLEKILDLNVNYQPSPKVDVDGNVYKIKMEKSVKLRELITVEEKTRDNQICSENRDITYSVVGEMGDRSVTYASIDILTKMYDYKLPFTNKTRLVSFDLYSATYEDENTGYRYVAEWDGEWELTLDVFRDLGLAMLVAIFLIYVILVAQFKSFRVPAVILGTIPLGLIGVLPGYAILNVTDGLYFNATSMIGVIALAGIVVNNAIIMIEYQRQLQEEGKSLKDAIITASATRLRPIVLTSLTTILGSLTLIGDPVWAGLGWSIILGMLASTVLTLTVFPVFLYTMIKTKK